MTSLSVRMSFRARAASIIQEFAIAVTLCGLVVLFAGGISETSMRVAAVIAAIYLTAAETRRQIPELAAHAMGPLRRLIRRDSRSYVDKNLGTAIDSTDLSHSIEALAAAARQSVETFANIERTMQRAMADLRISRERDQALVEMMQRIAEQSVSREQLLLDVVRQLQQISMKLDSAAASTTPPPRDPIDPTQVSWSSYEAQVFQLRHAALRAFERTVQTRGWQVEVELLAKYGDIRARDALAHRVALQTIDIERALSFYHELALPVVYVKQAELFHRLRSDPEALTRFIEELVARIAELER